MPNAIIDTSLISAVVNAVREKGGTTDAITLGNLPQAVADLPSGGGGAEWEQTVTDIESGSQHLKLHLFVTGGTFPAYCFSYNSNIVSADFSGSCSFASSAYTLYRCINLSSLTFNCTAVPRYFCQYNTALATVTIKERTKTINSNSFSYCTELKAVDIGNGITTIQANVFTGSASVETITVRAETPPSLTTSSISACTNLTAIYVPSASVDAYKAATNWSVYASLIQAIPEG